MYVFEVIRRGVRSQASLAEMVVRTALAVAIPTAMRWAIDMGDSGEAFALYYPSVLMVAVLLNWRCAAVAACASLIAGFYFFLPPRFGLSFGPDQLVIVALFGVSISVMVVLGHLLRTVVLESEAKAAQTEQFNQELQHRTKNTFQMMRALASRASQATDPAEFYETLEGRLGALAKANELLGFGAVGSCSMHDLIRAAVEPFGSRQIRYDGPACRVTRQGCTPLMMALHELGTNASKYGALSVDGGTVQIDWRIDEKDGQAHIVWAESGGPPVSKPERRGVGTRLLTPNGALRALVLEFRPEGVVCNMTLDALPAGERPLALPTRRRSRERGGAGEGVKPSTERASG